MWAQAEEEWPLERKELITSNAGKQERHMLPQSSWSVSKEAHISIAVLTICSCS